MPKTTITLQPCQSSRICAYGYDAGRQVLALQFKAKDGPGRVYEYQNVTPEIHQQFAEADSKGQFFGRILSDKAKHPHTHMTDDEKEKETK